MNSSERGSSTGALLAGFMAIGLALMYSQNQGQLTSQKVKEAQKLEESFDKSNMHLSNLSLLKGSLQAAKRGKTYAPSLYPTDYFADSWSFDQNKQVPAKGVSPEGNKVRLHVMNSSVVQAKGVAALMLASDSANAKVKSSQEMMVYKLNRDKDHPFWIRSVDVNSKIQSGPSAPSLANGRIALDAPVPTDIKIAIKSPGSSDFKVYSPTDPWPETDNPSGVYTFRVLGSGVILYAEIILDGKVHTVGMNAEKMTITHGARNIAAVDKAIGEVEIPIEGKSTTTSSTSTHMGGGGGGGGEGGSAGGGSGGGESCKIGAGNAHAFSQGVGGVGGAGGGGGSAGIEKTTTTTTVSMPTEVSLVVKLFGVDGQEASDITFKKSFTVGSKESKSSSKTEKIEGSTQDKPSNNCSEYCPMNSISDFDNDISNQAQALDRGAKTEADYRKVDFFNPTRTAETIDTGSIPGIICDNFDLPGKAMFSNTGMLASNLLAQDKGKYLANWNQYKSMYQSYIYIAPKCNRTVINERTSCGCFAEDTLIRMADGSEQKILDLRQGDWVWNPKSKKAQMIRQVVRGPENIPMYELHFGARIVLVTHGHPFLTEMGMAPASQLFEGQKIDMGEEWTILTRVVIKSVSEPAPIVWNIELEGTSDASEHFVLANGVMTGDLYLQKSLDSK